MAQSEVDAVEAGVARLGLVKGMVVQEFLYDADADEALRNAIARVTGQALVDDGYGDVTDAALVWYRNGDDDLADVLLDVQTLLDDGAPIWLLTPKAGLPNQVEQRDIEEAASLSGLHATSTFVISPVWKATQLVEKGRQK
ncbi:MAG: DUF3052 domain-containing protein [Demequinaceae bacterium]|nr:DUF3052 domain-containing protein [Demequinaceae bacterium]